MLTFLPAPLLGVLMLTLLCLNTLFWGVLVYAVILVKVVTPRGRWGDRVSAALAGLAQTWAVINVWMCDHVLDIRWDIRGAESLSRQGQYLVCANHQTWNDILVLMKTFGWRAPFFKFFIKRELFWMPVLGLVWWALDYPFMQRHTQQQLARNPELRSQDLETTRKACAHYRNQPVLILNFLEGTRFTPAKHARQKSPFRHLLTPKSGALAFTLAAMGDKFQSLLDVTLVYPDGVRGFWDFLAGRVPRVIVEVKPIPIPREMASGRYDSDPVFRKQFQKWLFGLWTEKDRRIGRLLAEADAG
ncbi:MAG: acyltransferase [Nevskiales bacterium]|nr:acyltransferase [Nevskiales bacterium]